MNDADLDRLIARAPTPPEPDSHPGDDELAAFAAHHLSADEARKIEVHLATCGACRDLAMELATDVPSGVFRLVGGLFQAGRARTVMAVAGAMVAVAAAVAVSVYRPPADIVSAFELQGPFGGLAEVRGDLESSDRFNHLSLFEVRVAPKDTPVDDTIACQLFLQKKGGLIKQAPDAWQRSPQGVFRYRAAASTVFGDGPGQYSVIVVVGRDLPAAPTTYRSVEELDAHTEGAMRLRTLATYLEKGDAL